MSTSNTPLRAGVIGLGWAGQQHMDAYATLPGVELVAIAGMEDEPRAALGEKYGVEHVVFVGRHTYYGAAADSPLFHVEDEPPMGLASFPQLADLVAADLYAGSALWRYSSFVTTVLRMVYTLGSTGHGTLATFLRGARVPTRLPCADRP